MYSEKMFQLTANIQISAAHMHSTDLNLLCLRSLFCGVLAMVVGIKGDTGFDNRRQGFGGINKKLV